MTKKKKGFTLIELLLVIGVIVILVGIVFAVRGPIVASARRSAWDASIQTLRSSLNSMAITYNDKFPAAPAAATNFETWAKAAVSITGGKTLAEFLDKDLVNPWNKDVKVQIAPGTGTLVALDAASGTPTILFSLNAADQPTAGTIAGTKYKIQYIVGTDTYTIFDDLKGGW